MNNERALEGPAFFRTLTIVGAHKYAPNGEAGRKAGIGGMLWNEAGWESLAEVRGPTGLRRITISLRAPTE